MFVVFNAHYDSIMYGPFNDWDMAVKFADNNLIAGIDTEIRLLIDPRFANVFTSTDLT